MEMPQSLELFKQRAGEKACESVRSGMCVGLGTGTTARYVILRLAELVSSGKLTDMTFVSTSEQSSALAVEKGLIVSDPDEVEKIDMVIDGADEVDGSLNLIKGGGGALFREKIVAERAEKMVVVVDYTKMVASIGAKPIPVEVVPFGHKATARKLAALGCNPVLREKAGAPYLTNNHNLIYDCLFQKGSFSTPSEMAPRIKTITGVVDHGIFVGLVRTVVCATQEGISIHTTS